MQKISCIDFKPGFEAWNLKTLCMPHKLVLPSPFYFMCIKLELHLPKNNHIKLNGIENQFILRKLVEEQEVEQKTAAMLNWIHFKDSHLRSVEGRMPSNNTEGNFFWLRCDMRRKENFLFFLHFPFQHLLSTCVMSCRYLFRKLCCWNLSS